MESSTSDLVHLARRFDALHADLYNFVKSRSSTDWGEITAEGWPVGVTARHIAVAHYPVIEWVQMVVEGNPLPPVTMDTVDQLNAQHAAEHQDCTQAEVAELLRTNHAKVTAYLATIEDQGLARESYLKLLDTDISAAQLFTAVLIHSAASHLASMQAAVLE